MLTPLLLFHRPDSLFTEYLFQEGIGQHQVIVSLDDFPGHLIGHLFIVVIIHRQRFR